MNRYRFLEPRPRFDYVTQLYQVEPTSSPDLELALPLADIKDYLEIDSDNTDGDSVLESSRQSNFFLIREYLNRAVLDTDFIASYKGVDREVLLPFYPASTVTEVKVAGEILDADNYELFAGRLTFQNGGTYENVEVQYSSTTSPGIDILNTWKRLIGIDYDNTDSTQKNQILKDLSQYRYTVEI